MIRVTRLQAPAPVSLCKGRAQAGIRFVDCLANLKTRAWSGTPALTVLQQRSVATAVGVTASFAAITGLRGSPGGGREESEE